MKKIEFNDAENKGSVDSKISSKDFVFMEWFSREISLFYELRMAKLMYAYINIVYSTVSRSHLCWGWVEGTAGIVTLYVNSRAYSVRGEGLRRRSRLVQDS